MAAREIAMTMLRSLIVGFALIMVALPATSADRTYTSDSEVREKGLNALMAKMSETRPVASLRFTPDEIVAMGQSDGGDGFLQWTAGRLNLQLFNLHMVSGPTVVDNFSVVDDRSGAFFRLSEANLDGFDAAVAAAVAYAKLEDIPVVSYVEIARAISIMPQPAYGDIRWTIGLRTDEESAVAYLTTEGDVIGGDLSDTKRADDLDLFTSDDWPVDEAQALLSSVLGVSRVHEVRIYQGYVFVTADHPTDPSLQRDYSWNLEGVTRGLVDTPNLVTLGMGDIATFPFSEVDLTKLPHIKAAAREAFGSPDAVITAMEASKPTDRAMGELKVLWEVEFREPNGEEGAVWLDASGNVVEVKLPESRLPEVGPWLAPATVIDTLRRISETFGPDAKLSEITINDTQASIDIEDPQAPGEIAHFLMDAREVTRFGSGSFFASLEPSNVFTPGELSGLTVEQLTEMVERTIAKLKMDKGEVFRFTFSRHALIMDPSDNRLMVEIRYGQEQGSGDAGWMTFLLDGTQTDELIP
jgi:hypothetical protein